MLNALSQLFAGLNGDIGKRTMGAPSKPREPSHPLLPAPIEPPAEQAPSLAGRLASGFDNPLLNFGLSMLGQDGWSTTPGATGGARFAKAGLSTMQHMRDLEDRDLAQLKDAAYTDYLLRRDTPDTWETVNGADGRPSYQRNTRSGEIKPISMPDAKPQMRERYEGSKVVQEQYDPATGEWKRYGEGERWSPPQRTPSVAYGENGQVYAVDPTTGSVKQFGRIDKTPPARSGDAAPKPRFSTLKVGQQVSGKTYLGGDPRSPTSWR